jgi:hypothetical protein
MESPEGRAGERVEGERKAVRRAVVRLAEAGCAVLYAAGAIKGVVKYAEEGCGVTLLAAAVLAVGSVLWSIWAANPMREEGWRDGRL